MYLCKYLNIFYLLSENMKSWLFVCNKREDTLNLKHICLNFEMYLSKYLNIFLLCVRQAGCLCVISARTHQAFRRRPCPSHSHSGSSLRSKQNELEASFFHASSVILFLLYEQHFVYVDHI